MSSFRVNKTFQTPISDEGFNELARSIVHEDGCPEKKLEILLRAKAFFNAEQAGHLISIYTRPKDKLKAAMILEPKLIPMSCQEARSILAAFSIPEDRVQALEYVKKALYDANTQEGVDNILFTFVYPEHKLMAMKIMGTVVNKTGLVIAAGGHQGYSALGGLYTSAKPNNLHIYGNPYQQVSHLPNHRIPKETIPFDTIPRQTTIYTSNSSDKGEENSYVKENNYLPRAEYLDTNKVNSIYS